jgi:LPS sulfotransferase NodH
MNEPTRFLIAGTQRTGTTLLRTSLSSHPRIACHGEVFKLGKSPYALPGGYWAFSRHTLMRRLAATLRPPRSFRAYLDQLYGNRDCSAVGFKLMLNQCASRPYLWPLICEYRVKAILITRRNVLKTLVSRRTAETTGVYHVSPSLPAKSAVSNWTAQPVRIEPKSLLDDLDRISNETTEWKRRLKDCQFMELIYEEYFQDQPAWNAKVLDFLGAPRHELSSDLRKVNPDELGSLVSNYDEIAGVIRTSRYSYCLPAAG